MSPEDPKPAARGTEAPQLVDLGALRTHLLGQLEETAYREPVISDYPAVTAWGSMLTGLAQALAAVRVELDREQGATASQVRVPESPKAPSVEEPVPSDWTPPPVETVWGLCQWRSTEWRPTDGGFRWCLHVVNPSEDQSAYIAWITPRGWCAFRGRCGNDGRIDRGEAVDLRNAYDMALAALRGAGSLA